MTNQDVGPLHAELAALAKGAAHPVAQSTVSEHLRILKAAGLVRGGECRGRVAYCIVPEALGRLKRLFAQI